MRQFIQDEKLLLILNEIEKWLGYAIPVDALPYRMWHTHGAAIGMNKAGWYYQYNPNDPASQFTLCHELMHVILGIEGWPLIATPAPLILDHARNALYDRLINFPQHVVINERMFTLGYKETDAQPQVQGNNQGSSHEEQAQTIPQAARGVKVKTHALCAAELLLAPPGLLLAKINRNTLQAEYPQCWTLTDAICRDAERHQPLDRQSGVDLLYSVLDIISEPKENLRPLLSCIPHCPQFFDRMVAKLGQDWVPVCM